MSDRDCLKIPLLIPTNAKDVALVTSEKSFVRHNLADRRHRLIFVREGMLLVQVGETTHTVSEDQALVIRAGSAFIRTHPHDFLLRYYALRFWVDETPGSPQADMDLPELTTLGRPDLVEELFVKLLNEQSDDLVEKRFAQLLFLQLLSEVADSKERKSASEKACIPLVERAKAHIRAHYDQPISTATVARSVDCSPGYLSRVFREATDSTVVAFIHEVRMFRARLLLTETNKSIAHIANECGFENPSYFQRLFHRYQAVSPGQYRRMHSRIYKITID